MIYKHPTPQMLEAKERVFAVLDAIFQGDNMLANSNITLNEHPEGNFKCLVCGAKWNIYDKKSPKEQHKPGCLALQMWEAYDAFYEATKAAGQHHNWNANNPIDPMSEVE